MTASSADRLLDRLTGLGLPHLGGRRVQVIGDDSGELLAFAEFQGALLVRESRDAAGVADQPGELDVVLWVGAPLDATAPGSDLDRLVARLAAGGVVVFQTAIEHASDAVKDVGRRWSRADVAAALSRFAVKMVPAPRTVHDPALPRVQLVFHVTARRPVACLMTLPPGYGKSSLARQLFPAGSASPPIISADSLVHRIALGQVEVAQRLRDAVRSEFQPSRIDEAVVRIMESGAVGDWVDAVTATTRGKDFVLDGFVPFEWQPALKAELESRGYLPVSLRWERQQPARMEHGVLHDEVLRFLGHNRDCAAATQRSLDTTHAVLGNIDSMTAVEKGITLCGWAVSANGQRPARFEVRLGRKVLEILEESTLERPDVMEHLGLPHARIGFCLLVKIAHAHGRLTGISVRVEDETGRLCGPLHWSG